MKRKLTVGLEPTTAGLEVQRAIQLRHASYYIRLKQIVNIARTKVWIHGKWVYVKEN